jgi:hypothetical protein
VFATGFNLASAPTFAKYGYPQLAESCVTDQAPALIKKYPGLFVFQQSTTTFAKGAIAVLKQLKDGDQFATRSPSQTSATTSASSSPMQGGHFSRKPASTSCTTNPIRLALKIMRR